MKFSLKDIISPNIPLAMLLFCSCILLWFTSFWGGVPMSFHTQNSATVDILQSLMLPGSLFSNIVSLLFTIINVILLTQLNSRFTIIRTRSYLPILFFLLLMASWNETHTVNGSHISLTLFLLSNFYFLAIYRDKNAVEQVFMSSLLIGVSSIIVNPIILFIPACWVGLILLQSFSVRTFFASVFGAIVPWILYFSVIFFRHPQKPFLNLLDNHFYLEIAFPPINIPFIVYAILLSIIMVICLVGMSTTYNNDSIHTRTKIKYIILLLAVAVVIMLLFNHQMAAILPTIALCYALLASHSFTLKKNKFWSILFLIFCGVNLLYVLSKYLPF